MSSKLPFESDAESVVSPDEPAKKRGRKPAVKRQAAVQRKKKQIAHDVSSESESDVEDTPQPVKKGRKAIKKTRVSKKQSTKPEEDSGSGSEGEEPKRKKSAILDESEEEKTQPIVAQKLQNLLWRKVASGYTSQRDFSKRGEFYIDFRISYTKDAETKDGYKKLLISYKSCVDKASDVYKAADKLVSAVKNDYKHITPVLYPKND